MKTNSQTHYVIQTDHLTKTYGSKTVLDYVNMHVAQGDIYGFIGKNGAGKTTLMKLLLGMSQPTSGTMSLFGITLVFSLLDLLINLIFVKVDNFNFNITDYQLEYVLMPLISGQALTKAELIRALVMPLSYAVVFVGGGWLVSQRRDV